MRPILAFLVFALPAFSAVPAAAGPGPSDSAATIAADTAERAAASAPATPAVSLPAVPATAKARHFSVHYNVIPLF